MTPLASDAQADQNPKSLSTQLIYNNKEINWQ